MTILKPSHIFRQTANDTLFILLFFNSLQYYFFMKHNFFIHLSFYFLLLLQKKAAPRQWGMSEIVCQQEKETTKTNLKLLFCPQNPCATGPQNLQFALFVDISRTTLNSEWRVGQKR